MRILLVTNMFPTPVRPNYGVFVKEQMEAVSHRYPDVEYTVYNIDPLLSGNTVYLKSIANIRRLLRTGNFDLVHVHYGLSGLFLLAEMGSCPVPVVLTLHGGDIQPEQGKWVQVLLTHQILRRVNVAITLNDRMTCLAGNYCPTVVKIPCSVNTDLFTPPTSRPVLAGREELTIVFPSDRTRTVKNYPLFRRAVELYTARYGTPIREVELKNMTRLQIADTLRGADLMLLTSISEGSPQVVKEAMACNLPVVSTHVGDVDMLLQGVAGSGWVKNPTAEELVQKMREAVEGRIPGVEGRQRLYELGLDHDSVAAQVYNVYTSLSSPTGR